VNGEELKVDESDDCEDDADVKSDNGLECSLEADGDVGLENSRGGDAKLEEDGDFGSDLGDNLEDGGDVDTDGDLDAGIYDRLDSNKERLEKLE
jgi:hypothetical protein